MRAGASPNQDGNRADLVIEVARVDKVYEQVSATNSAGKMIRLPPVPLPCPRKPMIRL